MSGDANVILGIDIGGTGIKGGLVDLERGELVSERFRLETPEGARPKPMGATVGKVAAEFEYEGPCGVAFPGVIMGGIAMTAANLHHSWVGASMTEIVGSRLPGPAVFVNDADAAGLAEVRYGAGKGHRGLVVMVTLGTGLGTALIHDGRLVPNAELGHIEIDGRDAETHAAVSVMERDDLSWHEWARRISRYLQRLEKLIWPEVFILGGGISKKPERWLHLIENDTPLLIAQLRNNAGIVGAALSSQVTAQP